MAVKLPIRLLFAGQGGERTLEERSYKAVWLVEVDDPQDDQVIVMAVLAGYLGQPWVGLGTGVDLEALCKGLSASRVAETRLFWLVEGNWETPPRDQDNNDGETSDDPDDWRDRVDVAAAKFSAPMERAKIITDLPMIGRPSGSFGPVVNAAKEVYDPPPEKEDSHRIYRITRAMKKFPAMLLDEYENAINSEKVTLKKDGLKRTFEPLTLKLEPAVSSLQYHRKQDGTDVAYYWVPFEFHHKKAGWRFEIVNRGFNRRGAGGDPDGRGGTISPSDLLASNGSPHMRRIVDSDDNPLGPTLLDLNGQPVTGAKDATYLVYAGYDELPFGKLGIWS